MPLDPPAPQMDAKPMQRSFDLDEAAFARIAEIMRTTCGIKLNQTKSNLIISRLGRRIRHLDLAGFDAYLNFVESASGREELHVMTSLLTTNVTRFFREPHHFDMLRAEILPKLLAKAQTGSPVRIWSAGCSSGEEPLSIAMEVLKLCPEAEKLNLRILGTDLDTVSVQHARRAVYGGAAIAHLPHEDRDRFFEPAEDLVSLRAKARLRALITYAELNLIGAWPMERAFDVIFCRNVVIYFDTSTQAVLWPRFAAALVPGGTLFIGHSERLSGPGATRFRPTGITQYERV